MVEWGWWIVGSNLAITSRFAPRSDRSGWLLNKPNELRRVDWFLHDLFHAQSQRLG
jgi:hypothetical protein